MTAALHKLSPQEVQAQLRRHLLALCPLEQLFHAGDVVAGQ